MLVHQAIYGNSGGGHALLLDSGGSNIPFAEITWRTDLPGTAPVGTQWKPFVSGFPYAEFYVLVKTFPDLAASRGGMVLSHALFVSLREAIHFPAIDGLVNLFLNIPERPSSVRTAEIVDVGNFILTPPAGTVALTDALVTLERKTPVVWIGQDYFTEAVLFLWSRLWPTARSRFHFRLSFGPQDCQELAPEIVSTPCNLESRWDGYRLIRVALANARPAAAAQFLLDNTEGNALRQFAQEIGAQLGWFQDLTRLHECQQYYEKGANATIDDQLALIRLIARHSPRAEEGRSIKDRAVFQLASVVGGMSPRDVRKLRNLDLNAFMNGDLIWHALSEWVEASVLRLRSSDAEMAEILADTGSKALAVTAWKDAIVEGVQRANLRSTTDVAVALWRWWARMPSLVETIAHRFALKEDTLADTCPNKLSEPVAEAVLNAATAKEWYRLHGVAAAAGFQPETAIERQLKVDHVPTYSAGVRCALGRASPTQVIDATLHWKDSRLVTLAGELCVSDTALLNKLDVGNSTWLLIWTAALERNPAVWQSSKEFEKLVGQLLDVSLEGCEAPSTLWAALARTPLGDLSNQPRRAEAWERLSPAVVSQLLDRTADGWLGRFEVNCGVQVEPEPSLRRSIVTESRLVPFLRRLIPTRIGIGVRLFQQFRELSETQFENWFDTIVTGTTAVNLQFPDAELLGQLLKVRAWKRPTAKLAAAVRGNRHEFGPALHECYSLLSLWDRIRTRTSAWLRFPAPSLDELWQLLELTATELYPEGPAASEVWSRAGGSKSVLRSHGTGESNWHDALRLLRHGGGKTNVRTLLETMLSDFPHNERLRWLEKQQEFTAANLD